MWRAFQVAAAWSAGDTASGRAPTCARWALTAASTASARAGRATGQSLAGVHSPTAVRGADGTARAVAAATATAGTEGQGLGRGSRMGFPSDAQVPRPPPKGGYDGQRTSRENQRRAVTERARTSTVPQMRRPFVPRGARSTQRAYAPASEEASTRPVGAGAAVWEEAAHRTVCARHVTACCARLGETDTRKHRSQGRDARWGGGVG